MKNAIRGVNLIELMVVVTILAVIGAIAIPSFVGQVRTANRMDAKRILMQLQSTYERYYAENNNVYPTVGITATYAAMSLGSPPSSSFYTFADSMGGNSAYGFTATATGSQAGDTDCLVFTINNLGNRSATSASCW